MNFNVLSIVVLFFLEPRRKNCISILFLSFNSYNWEFENVATPCCRIRVITL